MHVRRYHVVLVAISVATSLALAPGIAAAKGGASVAKTVIALPNGDYYGNTSTDRTGSVHHDCGGWEFWTLALTAGDDAFVAGGETLPAANLSLRVYPAGTDAANIATTDPIVKGALDVPAPFKVHKSGDYLVAIGVGVGCALPGAVSGQFDFDVSVSRFVKLTTTKPISSGTRGSLTVDARTKTGVTITDPGLTIELQGSWRDTPSAPPSLHVLAKGHPSNGEATLHYSLPTRLTHSVVTFTISGSGMSSNRVQYFMENITVKDNVH